MLHFFFFAVCIFRFLFSSSGCRFPPFPAIYFGFANFGAFCSYMVPGIAPEGLLVFVFCFDNRLASSCVYYARTVVWRFFAWLGAPGTSSQKMIWRVLWMCGKESWTREHSLLLLCDWLKYIPSFLFFHFCYFLFVVTHPTSWEEWTSKGSNAQATKWCVQYICRVLHIYIEETPPKTWKLTVL